MKYFKIHMGYSKSIQIDETELAKTLKAQRDGAIVYLGNGVINTKHISLIEPDYNRAIGWNDDYKPTGNDDFAEIAKLSKDYRQFLETVDIGETKKLS